MHVPKPIFDETRLGSLMDRDGLDLVLATSRVNVGYLSNWLTHHWTWDWPFWFEMEKEYDGWDYLLFAGVSADAARNPFFVTFDHHVNSVRQKSWIEDIRGAGRPGYTPRPGLESVLLEPTTIATHIDRAVEAIEDRSLGEATIGVELCRIPQSVYAELTRRLPKARFVDAFEMLLELRSVKSASEITRLRRAAEITTLIFNDVIFPMLREKATAYEIYERASAVAARERGYFLFFHVFVDGGHVSVDAARGEQKPVSYNIDPDTRFEDGQLAFVDFGCGYKGYCADMCRNVVIGGKPTNRQRRVHAAILDARDAVRAGIRPGIKASDLFDIGVNVLDKHDLGPAISLVGHGLGLSIHENPCLTAFDHRPLEPGMVINIEPNTEVPGMTMFNVEDTGVVTEDGFDPFSTLTTDLDVLAR